MKQAFRTVVAFRWKVQMIGYWALYLCQGAFLGVLGPSLSEMATHESPVATYGPLFAAHGCGAILSAAFLADFVIRVCLINYGRAGLHMMLGTMALIITVWMATLPAINRWGGYEWVTLFSFLKGVVVAIANVTISKCAAWSASDNINTKRVVNSLNGAFACGTVLV